MWKAYDSNLWRGNYTFVHIYIKGTEREDPNFASFLVQFLLGKKESLLLRSVPMNRS